MTAILGGGISGLSAAYYCVENPRLQSTVLYEASNRLGGWIKSVPSPRGVLFEKGPRTIRPYGLAGENTLELVNKLNLNDKIMPITASHAAVRNRLIYVNKKLITLPNSFTSLFKTNEPFNRPLVSMLWTEFRIKRIPKEDESIYSFVERRLGRDIADYLISPMICGICAGNAKEISVNFLLKNAFEYEQKYGSISRGVIVNLLNRIFNKKQDTKSSNRIQETKKSIELVEKSKKEQWSIWSLEGGLEQLPKTLKNYLSMNSNVKINTNSVCEQITFKQGEVELLVDGKLENYCRVISSLPAKNLAPLLLKQHPQLSRELEAIPSATVAVVNLHYSGNILPLEGFGFLVPPNENIPILGVIFDSCVVNADTSTVSILNNSYSKTDIIK